MRKPLHATATHKLRVCSWSLNCSQCGTHSTKGKQHHCSSVQLWTRCILTDSRSSPLGDSRWSTAGCQPQLSPLALRTHRRRKHLRENCSCVHSFQGSCCRDKPGACRQQAAGRDDGVGRADLGRCEASSAIGARAHTLEGVGLQAGPKDSVPDKPCKQFPWQAANTASGQRVPGPAC
jgi:hypothetical protein